MDWLSIIKEALDYMEKNLREITGPDEVAAHVNCSSMYLQTGFRVATGYSIGEYVRNRRLYQAALELGQSNRKVIDVALDYGYETPESFTKAFTRFHNASPSEVRADRTKIKLFLPMRVTISILGGENMNYVVEKMDAMKFIGFARNFHFENSQAEIPKFWDEIFSKYGLAMMRGQEPATEIEKAMRENGIGEYGLCIDNLGIEGQFRYVIGGAYKGGAVPEGLEVYEVPALSWAKFECIGAMPNSLQLVNNYIWNEWLPGNKEYELDSALNLEWYSSEGKTSDSDYKSAIWLPVRKIQK